MGELLFLFSDLWIVLLLAAAVYVLIRHLPIVPQQMAYIVERLGRYRTTLGAGIHLLVPFIDRVAYRHSLKEYALDVPPQNCITQDNVSIEVDGVLYLRIVDPVKASYGISDYNYASIQLAQTTMRSIIGTMPLDKTFEERDNINQKIISAVDLATDPWGIKVTRYEIKAITPPKSIQDAMEKEMRAEREKRAVVAESVGKKEARINEAIGEREQLIQASEGEKQRRINEADGRAYEIQKTAEATAEGIRIIAEALASQGGEMAMNMRLAEAYIKEFGKLAGENSSMIIPADLSSAASLVASLTNVALWAKK